MCSSDLAAAAARSTHFGNAPYRWNCTTSPAALHSINWAIRRSRVASCFAVSTQLMHCRR